MHAESTKAGNGILRRLGTLAVLAAVLGGCTGAPPPEPSPAPSTPPTSAAPRPDLVVTLGTGDAAMGLRVLTIELTNEDTRPRTVRGYPSIRLRDAERDPIEVRVRHGSGSIATMEDFDAGPSTLTLEPGGTAVAGLVWRNTVTDATVPATEGKYLEVAPMEGEAWQEVPLDAPVDLGNTGELGVSAWAPPRQE
ncbi:DUF4232 domain-containing protein [Amycolatopsis aidingensis]|uniref:DUF4232 domain-containing protein n=1 Tax=Amycolatopsis aidingensis TaxID=2842453 RepID=UPI001E6369F9|nr:DUF4232 domain-containing protein [Amycolatopsis aidingensis]